MLEWIKKQKNEADLNSLFFDSFIEIFGEIIYREFVIPHPIYLGTV